MVSVVDGQPTINRQRQEEQTQNEAFIRLILVFSLLSPQPPSPSFLSSRTNIHVCVSFQQRRQRSLSTLYDDDECVVSQVKSISTHVINRLLVC